MQANAQVRGQNILPIKTGPVSSFRDTKKLIFYVCLVVRIT